MNKIKISASYNKKVQVKQYEPIEIGCFVEQDFEKNDNMEEDYRQLFDFCKEQVEKRVALETRIVDAKNINPKARPNTDGEVGELI